MESAQRKKQWRHSHTFRLVSPSRLAVVMWQVPSARSDDSSTKSAGKVSSLATRTMSPTWVDRKTSATVPEKTFNFKWGESDLSCGSLKLEKGRVCSATIKSPKRPAAVSQYNKIIHIQKGGFEETLTQCSKTVFLVLFPCHCLLSLWYSCSSLKNTTRKLCAGSSEVQVDAGNDSRTLKQPLFMPTINRII